MKKIILTLFALVMVTMTASAYDLKVGTSDYGRISFLVGGTQATSAEEGQTVTVSIVCDGGYIVTEVTNELYSSWNSARSATVDMQTSVEMNKVDDNTYTFTMPRANVEVSVTYAINIDTKADETKDEEKEVDGVTLDMTVAEGESPHVDPVTGENVIPVAVESVHVPQQAEQKEITVVVAAVTKVGNNVFVVKEIKADAFKTPAESNTVVSKVVLPETEEPLKIENGAMKPNGNLLDVETPLSMLDDYALMASMRENFEAKQVSATTVAPERFWTFSSGVDVVVPEGVTVYRAFIDNEGIRILPIEEANRTRIIKANNGVLLSCNDMKGGEAYEFVANPGGQASGTVPATTDAKSYAGNAMVPTIVAKNYPANQYYIMKGNQFHTISSNGKVPACKAVYSVAKANQ